MGPVELARPLADPEQVRGRVVAVAGGGIDPRQGLLEAEQQAFVGGEHLDLVQHRMALRRHAKGAHEVQRIADLIRQLAVAGGVGAALDESQRPFVDVVQVGIAAPGEGAEQVQGGGRLIVRLHQPFGIGRPLLGGESHAVDVVAAIGGQRHLSLRLDRRGARLGELAGHAGDLHHRLTAGEGHHHRHLQQQTEGVADVVGAELLEALGAVSALQQEGLALRHLLQELLQPPRLAGEDQGRHPAQLVLDAGERRRVRIVIGDVPGGLGPPALGRPALGHGSSGVRKEAGHLAHMGS